MTNTRHFPPEIDESDLRMIAEGYMEQHGRAFLAIVGDSYVMTGPSGTHTLLAVATDLDRLNAHWRLFASHPLNFPAQETAA